MEVALDLTPALSGLTGVARYALHLAAELPAAGITVRGFGIGRGPGTLPPGSRHLRVPLRVVQPTWRHLGVPRAEWVAGGGDVVHSVDLTLPPTKLPLVATVHDLATLDRPDLHPPAQVTQMRARLAALDAAAIIITVSQTTADALARHGVDPGRVVVTPLAATPLSESPARSEARPPYLLAVGELTARKDYPTLIRALAQEPARDLRLVMAGPRGYRADEVAEVAAATGVADRVEMLGRVSDAELADLYRGATALCLTSVIEGFGLPLVEAMAVGLPIVASDIEVAREVAGDAAVYAPVGDAEAFAAAVHRVATDDELRATLQRNAALRSQQFSWARTAELTAAAYRKAAACD
jgi:glycosyltransferase involved in cell wall biosynthesis